MSKSAAKTDFNEASAKKQIQYKDFNVFFKKVYHMNIIMMHSIKTKKSDETLQCESSEALIIKTLYINHNTHE